MTEAQLKERKSRIQKMIKVWEKMFPEPISELEYTTDWEFVVAVILSAQCTDKRVNQVTKKLFKKYKKISDYANADIREFEQDIFSTGFYRNKAQNIIASARLLKEKYNETLPKDIDELQKFPGVGRKTANVVLSNLYGINVGIAIDTHAIRICRKFDLVDPPYSPESIERDLLAITPKKHWGKMNHYLVLYGRYHAPAHAKFVEDELTKIYPKASYKLEK
jgi:endonuclease-3